MTFAARGLASFWPIPSQGRNQPFCDTSPSFQVRPGCAIVARGLASFAPLANSAPQIDPFALAQYDDPTKRMVAREV